MGQIYGSGQCAESLQRAPFSHSLHGAESLKNKPVLSLSRNSPYFMESEGSLPRLQVSATCPYTEPDKSSQFPTHHTS